MRDWFGLHARRARRALAGHLPPGDSVELVCPDAVQRTYWVLTTTELIQVHPGRTIVSRVALVDAVGSVTQTETGVTVLVSSRHDHRTSVATFRTMSELPRRLEAILKPPARPS